MGGGILSDITLHPIFGGKRFETVNLKNPLCLINFWILCPRAGPEHTTCTWLWECYRQVEVEVVSNRSIQLHQTTCGARTYYLYGLGQHKQSKTTVACFKDEDREAATSVDKRTDNCGEKDGLTPTVRCMLKMHTKFGAGICLFLHDVGRQWRNPFWYHAAVFPIFGAKCFEDS